MKFDSEKNDSGNKDAIEPADEVPEPKESGEQDKVSDLEKKNLECLERLKRLQADFDNYKKRVAKEREEYSALATERIVKQLLDLSDDFERAIANSKDSDDGPLRDAIEMMYKQLKEILRKEGVVEIATDCMLDPFEHEAMSKVGMAGKKEGEIVECLQKGYKIRDKVIRPARVVVCHFEEGEKGSTIKDGQKLNLDDEGYIDTDE